ncbi:MAG: hypothetical protein WAL16_06185, partial [Streptosporangiaceae bacterium]
MPASGPARVSRARRARLSAGIAIAGAVAVLGAALGAAGPASAAQLSARPPSTHASFRQIILPDLLIVAPKGLTAGQIARLRAIHGVQDMITFDGAQIMAAGRPVSVIGVNPATFRSWVPLRTASDQAFWTALAAGDFVAASGAGRTLKLKPGSSYRLSGSSSQVVKFGMAAKLDLAGVDLLVNPAESAKLGLVRQVAGLISAPGVRAAVLTRKVSAILGPG